MTVLDFQARQTAVTAIDRSFLVEAGAGVGKTSVLSARIVRMLACGVSPKKIAAVTFTEAAASELLGRVRNAVSRIIDLKDGGDIGHELRPAFPDGVTSEHRANLRFAKQNIGLLTITTIHGFCQRLIKPYPVEADIDPGATIVAGPDAELMFNDVFDRWVRDRLSANNSDLITSMIMHDAPKAIGAIRSVAYAMRGSPDLQVSGAVIDDLLVQPFIKSVTDFIAWHEGLGYADAIESHMEVIATLRDMQKAVASIDLGRPHLAMMSVVSHGLNKVIFTTDGKARLYRQKGKFEKAGGKARGAVDHETAVELYNACALAFLNLRATIATAAIRLLADEVQPLLDAYQDHKRAAASLDFDDLLNSALRMLKNYPQVRAALSERYAHILVDEFQDTDPVQTEIFMLLTFVEVDGVMTVPRPGALFLVGDPKQAIYRFRRADVRTYVFMRDLLRHADPASVLQIFVNFRSQDIILSHVNDIFQPLFDVEGQPGFTALEAFHTSADASGLPAVSWFKPDLVVEPEEDDEGVVTKTNVKDWRKGEADAIARICLDLIGKYQVPDKDGTSHACRPGDIALLVPQGTELYLYENALEALGIPVSTQAGKGLYRQQEIQDMVAITRLLADERDTLALGAFLRGPLAGFTEQELLDQSHLIPNKSDGKLAFLHLGMDTSILTNSYLRQTIETLTTLRDKALFVSPHDVLSEAATLLMVRPKVRARFQSSPERRLANIDRFLEMSSTYDVRGLRAFSDAIRESWEDGERTTEGRPDQNDDAVNFITMHSAKGLEWPVVIPINTMTSLPKSSQLVKNVARNAMTMPFFDIKPTGYNEELTMADMEDRFERFRLWYVAMTRAKNLLILAHFDGIESRGETWAELIPVPVDKLPQIDLSSLTGLPLKAKRQTTNQETAEAFGRSANIIQFKQKPKIEFVTPSKHEWSPAASNRLSMDDVMLAKDDLDPYANIKGGMERGNILHKLMEEVLTGELKDEPDAISARSLELIEQIVVADLRKLESLFPAELTRCVINTLNLPVVAEMRPRLIPEMAASSREQVEDRIRITYGIVDAAEIVLTGENSARIETVIDWKSDLRPNQHTIDLYVMQVRTYLKSKNIAKGLIVFMSSGNVVEVTADSVKFAA